MNSFFLILISILYIIPCQSSENSCSITVSTDIESKIPIFKRNFGTAKINYHVPKSGEISLRHKESIDGYCSTSFEPIRYFHIQYNTNNYGYTVAETQTQTASNLPEVTLKCNDGTLAFVPPGYDDEKTSDIGILSCKSLEWNLFEMEMPHYSCLSETKTYFLTFEANHIQNIFAAVCFNIQDMTLESIRFTVSHTNKALTQGNFDVLHPPELTEHLLGDKVENWNAWDFNEYDPSSKTGIISNNHRSLLGILKYRRDNIIQNEYIPQFFDNSGNFLKINWWHNLLHGNWKRFMEFFEKQTAIETYDVLIGVSGAIKEPYYSYCADNGMEKLEFIQHDEVLPTYIWAHLSARNSMEEVVIIGFNSPFFEFFNPRDIIFCENMCEQISWLKDAQSTFSYATLGIIFCCKPEDVSNAGVLKTFPSSQETVDEESTPGNF